MLRVLLHDRAFVDTPEKLTPAEATAISITLVMLTAIVELVAPGSVIIPGWIDLGRGLEEGGRLTARVEKIRVGGALASDANMADFGSFVFCLLGYFAWKARNPAEKVLWALATAATLVGVLSTGNRGGLIGLGIAIVYTTHRFMEVPFACHGGCSLRRAGRRWPTRLPTVPRHRPLVAEMVENRRRNDDVGPSIEKSRSTCSGHA
jgi:hypothetical protein